MGIEPTMSGDKCFTGTIDTLSGLARVSEPAFIVALFHVSLLKCKKAAQSPERPWRKIWTPSRFSRSSFYPPA